MAGRELVDAMLSKGATYESISKALRVRTGESIGTSSLERYRRKVWLSGDRLTQAQETRLILREILSILCECRDALQVLNGRSLRVISKADQVLNVEK